MKNLFYILVIFLFFLSCAEEKKENAVVSITVKEVQSVDGRDVKMQFGSAFYGEDEAIPDVTLGELKIPYIQRIDDVEVRGRAFTFRIVSDTLLDATVKINGKTAYQSQGKEHKPKTEIILRKYD